MSIKMKILIWSKVSKLKVNVFSFLALLFYSMNNAPLRSHYCYCIHLVTVAFTVASRYNGFCGRYNLIYLLQRKDDTSRYTHTYPTSVCWLPVQAACVWCYRGTAPWWQPADPGLMWPLTPGSGSAEPRSVPPRGYALTVPWKQKEQDNVKVCVCVQSFCLFWVECRVVHTRVVMWRI